MADTVLTVLKVVVSFCLLILVHELGHFLVAKRLGIGVQRFSIGFGPKIWGFRRGETEYLLAVIPLGGFVKLLGDDPRGVEREHPRAFLNKPILARLAVVAAGPLANFALAIARAKFATGPAATTAARERSGLFKKARG